MMETASTHGNNTAPPFDITFASLVWPAAPDVFMQNIWQQEPVFVRGSAQRLGKIAELIPFKDVRALLALSVPAPIEVFLRNECGFHEQFQCHSIDEALDHYRDGRTLYFHINRASQTIRDWLQGLSAGMGLSNTAVRASLFMSRYSAGIAPHFDANENFTIQLAGAKTWEIAPNEHLDNPTSNYFIGEPIDPGMRAYVHHEMPGAMPANSRAVHMQSGAMLYLPAGYWHTTRTTEQESISLNLVFPRITWADVFLQSVRPILLQNPRWRARADDLIGSVTSRAGSKPVLEALIGELSGQLGAFTRYFSSVNEFAEPNDAITDDVSLQRNLLVAWRVLPHDKNTFLLEFHPPLDAPVSLKATAPLREVCEWIGNTSDDFTYGQLRSRFAEYAEADLLSGLAQLLKAGYIQYAPVLRNN